MIYKHLKNTSSTSYVKLTHLTLDRHIEQRSTKHRKTISTFRLFSCEITGTYSVKRFHFPRYFAHCQQAFILKKLSVFVFFWTLPVTFVLNCSYPLKNIISNRTATGLFWLRRASLQDQYRNFKVRLTQSKSPSQRWRLFCFHSNTVTLTLYNSLL